MANEADRPLEIQSLQELESRVPLGEMMLATLADSTDPRAPEARRLLREQINEVQVEIGKRYRERGETPPETRVQLKPAVIAAKKGAMR